MAPHANAPVVGVDIDGNLGDYYTNFTWFLENIFLPHAFNKNTNAPPRPWWKPEYRGDFAQALGLDKETYRKAKLAYRQGGMKRCMPTLGNVRKLAQDIRSELGAQVWICTSRPYLRLDNIDPDTQYWLHYNVGPVDGLLFHEDKWQQLIDNVGKERILGVFDDLPESIERAAQLGLNPCMRSMPHNDWWRNYEELRGINSTDDYWTADTTEEMRLMVEEWKVLAEYANNSGISSVGSRPKDSGTS